MKTSSTPNVFFMVSTKDSDIFDVQEESCNDTKCGIGMWKPTWLQRFASPKLYLLNFCFFAILQSAYFAYFIAIISTLEKRFAFNSKISGIIIIAGIISQLLCVLSFTYYGSKGCRPKWIVQIMLMTIVSYFVAAFPYFVYGRGTHVTDYKNTNFINSTSEFCIVDTETEKCDPDKAYPACFALITFFVANFLEGIGSSAFYIIGLPYLDDHVSKKNSSLYFSFMFGLRIFGAVLGFFTASVCLHYYEEPYHDPGFNNDDPRWIGAWWIGFLILGVLLLISALPLFFFPRHFTEENIATNNQISISIKSRVKEMVRTVTLLLNNNLLVFHTLSITLHAFGIIGYYIFLTKYIENQFRKTSSFSVFSIGLIITMSMFIGLMITGNIIRKVNPKIKYFTGYISTVGLFTIIGLLLTMTFNCPNLEISGTYADRNSSLINECNMDCKCTTFIVDPVCDADTRSNYFSPCFAGCSGFNHSQNDPVYTDCKCLYDNNNKIKPLSTAVRGFCPLDCNSFLPFIIILSLTMMIVSTARVGNLMITFRCVEPRDKNLAFGFVGIFISLFALLPSPLIFGALVDSTCLVWEENCGKTGNCWIYDTSRFRNYLHVSTAISIFFGMVFDFVVFRLSERITGFYEDNRRLAPFYLSKIPMEIDDEDILYTKISDYCKTTDRP